MSTTAHCERCGLPDGHWNEAAQLWLCPDCQQDHRRLGEAGERLKMELQPHLTQWLAHWRRVGLEDRDLRSVLATVLEELSEAVD